MYIRRIGYNHTHDANFRISRPHGSGDYLLLLLKTPAIFTLNGSDIMTESDSFILYKENTPQFYRAYGSQFSNDWFHFKLESDDDMLLNELGIPQNQVIHIGNLNELSMIINNLCYETYTSNPHKFETIELYLKLFFIKLSNKLNNCGNGFSNTHYNKMALIRTKIYNQPYYHWDIERFSNELSMSRSCFQHLYKDFFGVSPINDVIISRIEHAKYLLSSTDISIKRISEMCGYNNDIHFMRQFKKQTELTPSEYRKRKRNI